MANLGELGCFKRESSLTSPILFDEKGTVDDGLIDQTGCPAALNVKGEPAPADAFGLVLHKFTGSSANANSNPPEPVAKRAA